MKIKSIHFQDVGSLGNQSISFINDWNGQLEPRVLLSGPNGCGKSTVLRTIAMLWQAFGYWLDQSKTLPKNHVARDWLQRWGGCAVVFQDVKSDVSEIGLAFGDLTWCDKLIAEHADVNWFVETVARTGKPGNPSRKLALPAGSWVQKWSDERKKMILSFDKTDFPNVVFLDAEERRWVLPRKNVGEHVADQPGKRWLPKYIASEDWRDQLEASLITLKTTQLHKYHEVVKLLNSFLSGKLIESDIAPGENRLRVRLKGKRGHSHNLDELSAGEHQVLILLFLLSRWAEKGSVVLIDEPDLYLHPSLVGGMLSCLESLVADLAGQLIITSHSVDIWHRYEASGKRIELGAQL